MQSVADQILSTSAGRRCSPEGSWPWQTGEATRNVDGPRRPQQLLQAIVVPWAPPPFEVQSGASIADLPCEYVDVLIAERITAASARVSWEFQEDHFRFDTLGEALSSLEDCFVQDLLTRSVGECIEIKEMREYPLYSRDLATAWEIVNYLQRLPFSLKRDGKHWEAAFADQEPIQNESAPLAICLAALALGRLF
jgi:hypothetical protein